MLKEIEINSIEELSPDVIYHINMAADSNAEAVNSFALALRKQGLKALISRGPIEFSTLLDLVEKLGVEEKKTLLKTLSRALREVIWNEPLGIPETPDGFAIDPVAFENQK